MIKVIVVNWKMNLPLLEVRDLTSTLVRSLDQTDTNGSFESLTLYLCPPYPYLSLVEGRLVGTPIFCGAQDCSPYGHTLHTGDVSARTLNELGCSLVIVGHSERRKNNHESSTLVQYKAHQAYMHGLKAVICVSDNWQESQERRTLSLREQLVTSIPTTASHENTMVAYENLSPYPLRGHLPIDDLTTTFLLIRATISELFPNEPSFRLLYGGQVEPANLNSLLKIESVDGFLLSLTSLNSYELTNIFQTVQAWR